MIGNREQGNVGVYVVGEELGVGGMGRVLAAASPGGGEVAVKLLHPALHTDAVFAERLLQEARLASLITHPNVVRVVDIGSTREGHPFYVMRRVAGAPLGELIQAQGALPLRRIRHLAAQLLEGLAAIHAAGVVHGDLKSDNVLVDDDDRVTIIDFGLARMETDRRPAFGDTVLSGTPEYMAPEAIRGGGMTRASDVYAVGIILYEMLTGTTPFAGGTMTEIFERHLHDQVIPPSLRAAHRTIPAALEALVMRALAKEPERRHHSAALFATAVARAVPPNWREEVIQAQPPAYSPTASTRTWQRSESVRRTRQRFARGTRK